MHTSGDEPFAHLLDVDSWELVPTQVMMTPYTPERYPL
jgi:hypothetical protein